MCVRVELEGGLKGLALTRLRLFYLNSVLKKRSFSKDYGLQNSLRGIVCQLSLLVSK